MDASYTSFHELSDEDLADLEQRVHEEILSRAKAVAAAEVVLEAFDEPPNTYRPPRSSGFVFRSPESLRTISAGSPALPCYRVSRPM